MEQHFDFYHTKKPKKYVCNEHNKCYVYKKSYDEHLHRDHSDGNYRFVCDYCGKGFFHKSEFSIHRDSVHLKRKYYACNKCQQRAFTSIGHLNAHLAICGKEAKDFDVEKEEQKNSEVTITADETNQDEEGDNTEVTLMVPKKRRKKSPQKTFVNKKPGAKKGKGNDEDEEDDFYYHCDKCSQKFTD